MMNRLESVRSLLAVSLILAAGAGSAGAQSSPVQGVQIDPVTTRRGHGDNWLLTWASDDQQYTGWGDGFGFQGDVNQQIGTGFARIDGTPTAFTGLDLPNPTNPLSGNRWYTYGTLALDGILYAFISRATVDANNVFYFWSSRLVYCTDPGGAGQSWFMADGTPLAQPHPLPTESNMYFHDLSSPDPYARPFPLPTFLQMGRNYADNSDGYVYLYSPNGSTDALMRQVVLARVPKAQLRNKGAVQYCTGRNADGTANWSAPGDNRGRQAIHQFPAGWVAPGFRYSWIPHVVYNKGLGLYVMAAAGTGRNGQFLQSTTYLGIWTSPRPWGPWTQVHENSDWIVDTNGDGTGDPASSRCYIPGFAPKWTSADGRTMYLVYSNFGGNFWQGQNHPLYALNVQKVTFMTGSPPPNQPPTVSMTASAPGTTLTAPATIGMAAQATDPDGTVARVDFLHGAALLGSDLTAPYAFTWSGVPAGTYVLNARAVDNSGVSTLSAAVTVTVQAAPPSPNQPPTVSLTAPLSGTTTTAPATIGMAAQASDPDGTVVRVEFLRGATVLGSDTTAPYGFTWSGVAAGTYTLTARAVDNLGASSVSASVTVTVQSGPPPSGLAPGTYTLKARHSGKVLDVFGESTANGAGIVQWDAWGGANQEWIIEPLGDGFYRLLSRHSHKALDVLGVAMTDGAGVIQWDWWNGPNQHWAITPTGDGYHTLTARHSGKVLDVHAASAENGAQVIQWAPHGGANQQWLLERRSDATPVLAMALSAAPAPISDAPYEIVGESSGPANGSGKGGRCGALGIEVLLLLLLRRRLT